MLAPTVLSGRRNPWNKGKLVGQKAPLKLRDIWAIRVRLELADRMRELALFNLAIDSKLRGCDLVQLRVRRCGAVVFGSGTIVCYKKCSGRIKRTPIRVGSP